jgi:tryptophan-rich sensory protein
MLSPTLLSVIICVAAAILEGALAGKGARQRLAQLSMPSYSPPFALWLVIGFLFYAICFVILRHMLTTGLVAQSQIFALVLTIVLLLANALWSVLFFRHSYLMRCLSPHWPSFSPGHILWARSCFRVTAFILSMLLDGAIIYGD